MKINIRVYIAAILILFLSILSFSTFLLVPEPCEGETHITQITDNVRVSTQGCIDTVHVTEMIEYMDITKYQVRIIYRDKSQRVFLIDVFKNGGK